MKIKKFRDFVNESYVEIEDVEYSEHVKRSGFGSKEDRYKLTFYDSGDTRYNLDYKEVLANLRELGIKEIPSKPKSRSRVKLNDGTEIVWYRSTNPGKFIDINVKPELEKKYAELFVKATEYKEPSATEQQMKIWTHQEDKVKKILTEAWVPALEPKDIISGTITRLKISWQGSRFVEKNLPNRWDVVEDQNSTEFTVYADGLEVHFKPHGYKNFMLVEY